jgi:adenylate kinase family enzyme
MVDQRNYYSGSTMKIAVIGNAGGGKTTLSRRLAEKYNIPVFHVDSYQYLPDLKIRPWPETIQILNEIQAKADWIIDGFGPLDIIENRFSIADKIIFIDFPLWRHILWSTKRQIKSLWAPRTELPEGCNEFNFAHTIKLYKIIWRAHRQMRPELLRILARPSNREKVILIRTLRQLELELELERE